MRKDDLVYIFSIKTWSRINFSGCLRALLSRLVSDIATWRLICSEIRRHYRIGREESQEFAYRRCRAGMWMKLSVGISVNSDLTKDLSEGTETKNTAMNERRKKEA